MTARRTLPPDSDIRRVIAIAQELGCQIAGLDVGRDYVRTIPPPEGGDSVSQYVTRPAHRQEKGQKR